MAFVRLPKNRNTLEASFDLTPIRLQHINQSANGGWMQSQSLLGRELLEKFPPLTQVWNVRAASIASLKWFVSGNDKTKNSIVRNTLKGLTNSRDTLSFKRLLAHFQGENLFGYSVAEIDWADGGAGINGIKGHRSEALNYKIEDDYFYFTNEEGKEIPAEMPRFIQLASGIDPHRSGLVRPLALLYVRYRHILMQYLRGIEKYGVPMPVVGVDPILFEDSDERAKLEAALSNWTYDGFAIIDKDTIEFNFPTASANFSAEPFRAEMDAIEKQVARLILGQDSTTISDSSNRSTAAVHNMVRRDLVFADAMQIESVINEQIIAPLMAFNFGENSADVPVFKFDMQTADEIDQVANIAAKLSGAGLELDPAQLSARLGFKVTRKEATKEQF